MTRIPPTRRADAERACRAYEKNMPNDTIHHGEQPDTEQGVSYGDAILSGALVGLVAGTILGIALALLT